MSKTAQKLIEKIKSGSCYIVTYDDIRAERELYDKIKLTDFYRLLGCADLGTFEGHIELSICQATALGNAVYQAMEIRNRDFDNTGNYPDYFDYVYRDEDYIIVMSVNGYGGVAIIYNKTDKHFRLQTLGEDDSYFFPSSLSVDAEMMMGYLYHVTSTFNNIDK